MIAVSKLSRFDSFPTALATCGAMASARPAVVVAGSSVAMTLGGSCSHAPTRAHASNDNGAAIKQAAASGRAARSRAARCVCV